MLEKVKQYAMVKFAGDESQVKEFISGFTKAAMSTTPPHETEQNIQLGKLRLDEKKFQNESSIRGNLTRGFLQESGKGLSNLIMTLGVGGAGMLVKSIQNNQSHTHYLESLQKAIQGNDILKGAKKEKVLQYANTIFKFAPNVATDVNVLTAILTNAIDGDGIDPMTIKTLTELEGRFSENSSFSPKTYI